MPKFAANLSMLFNDVAFLDRFDIAAQEGFRAVEFMSPFEHPAKVVGERLRDNNLEHIIFNMPSGNRAAGDRGIACQPSRRDEFKKSVDTALIYAEELGTRYINCLAGIAPPDIEHGLLHATYVENLRLACREAASIGLKVLIEPLNTFDFPGFFLTRTDQAAAIVEEVGAPNLGIEYDVYHAQTQEGNLLATIKRFLPLIWHMQVADVPTRAEPGTGEIRFDYLFAELDAVGYCGWVGCDYHPAAPGIDHLDWVRPFLAGR